MAGMQGGEIAGSCRPGLEFGLGDLLHLQQLEFQEYLGRITAVLRSIPPEAVQAPACIDERLIDAPACTSHSMSLTEKVSPGRSTPLAVKGGQCCPVGV